MEGGLGLVCVERERERGGEREEGRGIAGKGKVR